MNATRNTQPELEDESFVTAIACQLWEQYWNEDKSEDDKRIISAFAKSYGVSENCKLAMMFGAFLAGLTKGLDLAEIIKNGGTETA